jgi:hypothetical protein
MPLLPSLYENLPDWEVEACARSVYWASCDPALYVIDMVDQLEQAGEQLAAESWRRIGIAVGQFIRHS